MSKNIAIVGGGASGMMAAIVAAQNGARVSIFEKNQKLGKKLTMTGNGRCNFTNEFIDSLSYTARYEENVGAILSEFGLKSTLDFFSEIGIEPKLINGLYYPMSLQAKSVRDCLEREIKRNRIKIHKDTEINEIKKSDVSFELISQKEIYNFDKVILACGGMSYSKTGSDGKGYELAKKLGHTIEKPLPALCALNVKKDPITKASGVRIDSHISAYVLDNEVLNERGELQITDYGISGIAVMDMSNYISRSLYHGRECSIVIDFLPELYIDVLGNCLYKRYEHNKDDNVYEALLGLLPDKLIDVILKKSNIDSKKKCKDLEKKDKIAILDNIKYYKVDIESTRGFEYAQITDGGVILEEINSDTMESNLVCGLYFAGEMIDVIGICGGYNLQWAWSSGYIAGKNASE